MSVFSPCTHVNHGTVLPSLLTESFFVSAGFMCLPEATERITLSSHSLIKVVKKSCQSLMHFKRNFYEINTKFSQYQMSSIKKLSIKKVEYRNLSIEMLSMETRVSKC